MHEINELRKNLIFFEKNMQDFREMRFISMSTQNN